MVIIIIFNNINDDVIPNDAMLSVRPEERRGDNIVYYYNVLMNKYALQTLQHTQIVRSIKITFRPRQLKRVVRCAGGGRGCGGSPVEGLKEI